MLGSAHYRKILLVRFLGYFTFLVGFIILILGVEPVMGEELKYRINQIFGVKHVLPQVITSSNQNNNAATPLTGQIEEQANLSGFASLLTGTSGVITPVATDFGIVVEKINANARVVANVDPADENAYTQALAEGVAHAKGTNYPGEIGNIYLFSHSTDAPWNIIRYNAIFYLLNKLEAGDKIILFYKGRRYDYIVFDKAITPASDTKYLVDSYNKSVLTLQTCDPPGTIINRLIVRAELAGG